METKIDGIVIDAKDYKDSDKLLTILTHQGKMFARLVGCKKPASKLKNVGQIFCFAEFIILNPMKKNSRIINAVVKDNFFEIVNDYDVFLGACEILKVVKNYKEFQDEEAKTIFLYCLKTLLYIKNYSQNYLDYINKFFINFLALRGYKIETVKCSKCLENFGEKVYINLETAETRCSSCYGEFYTKLPSVKYLNFLKNATLEESTKNEFDDTIKKETMNILSKITKSL